MNIQLSEKKLGEIKASAYGLIVEESFTFDKELQAFAQQYCPTLQQMLEAQNFTGRSSDLCVIPTLIKKELVHIIVIGLGKKNNKQIAIENYRRALGTLYKKTASLKCNSLSIQLPSAQLFTIEESYLVQQTALILIMTSYSFDDFITDSNRREAKINSITLCTTEKKALDKSLQEGVIIAQSVNKARHWIDSPPTPTSPEFIAKEAQMIAKKGKLTYTVFSEEEINKMGMGGLGAVSRGSELDCKLVILEYKVPKKNVPTIAIVGKGITFDSGGLSIKPASSMETMKEDMSGAAAIITTMEAISQLKPTINVIGIAPLAENLPSGNAIKPGDIVTFYNGKTAEIKNTDAEGRLILGDALSYAVKQYKPDAIIDVATLTGSCAHALGPFYSGLMSQHDELTQKVFEASERSGERVWRLPMSDDYKPAIKTDVADISNIGTPRYMAGAITAAFFLQHFVNDTPWVHLDIAGTAFNVPDISYYRSGATGVGVRLLVDLIMNWKE